VVINKQTKKGNKMKLVKILGVLLATTALFAITAGAATNAPVATATPVSQSIALQLCKSTTSI